MLLERERELTVIEDAIQSAESGAGALVIIEGVAGLGKSRLLGAAREICRRREVTVAMARANELESAVAFDLAHRLLGGAQDGPPRRPDAGEGIATIEALHGALLTRLYPPGEPARPLTMLVDDLHWCDRASLRFLARVLLELPELPVAAILTTRPKSNPDPVFAGIRAAPAAGVLELSPLGRAAVSQLVAARWGPEVTAANVSAVHRVTGGNPFYVTELLSELSRHASDATATMIDSAAPSTVLYSVLARLGAMDDGEAPLASALAILGDGSSLRTTARLAELTVAAAGRAADALARADILAAGEPLRFAHPLIGSTLLADMGAFARATAHRRAGEVLAAEGAGVERVATHCFHARPASDERVVQALRAAAESASARGEPESAVRLLRRALEEPPVAESRGALLCELAQAEATAALPAAIVHFEQALEVIGDARVRAQSCLDLAQTVHHAGDFARAGELADRGRAELPGDDPLSARLLGAWFAAAILHAPWRQEMIARSAHLIRALEGGEAPSEPMLLVHLASLLGVSNAPAGQARALAEAAFADDPLVDGDPRGAALGFAAWALIYLDAHEPAERLLDRAALAATERGAVIATSIVRHMRAYVHYHRGRLAEAIVDAEHSLEIYRFGWTDSAWSTPILTLAHLGRGDLDRAAETIAIGEAAGSGRAEEILLLEARSQLRLAQGDPAAALADARAAGDISEGRYGIKSDRGFDWVRLAAGAAHALGDADAGRLAEDALGRARESGVPRQLGLATMTSGLVRGGEDGLALLRESVAIMRGSPSEFALAQARLELGAALRRAGSRTAAKDELYAALELAAHFEAAGMAERARTELRMLGLRPRRTSTHGSAALTPSELTVAQLAAAGLSTPRIAHQLCVTRRTVESHLYRIYRKLGITTRRELAAALPR